MTAVAASGIRVVYLHSGVHHAFGGRQRIVRGSSWRGVGIYQLVNSVVRSPALFELPRLTATSDRVPLEKAQISLVRRWLVQMHVRQVWVHSIEGQPLNLLVAMAKDGLDVRVFCHDHFYVCPRVTLLQRGARLCLDHDQGRACLTCVPPGFARGFETRAALAELPVGLGRMAGAVIRRRDDRVGALQSGSVLVATMDPDPEERLLRQLRRREDPTPPLQDRRARAAHALASVRAVYCPSTFVASQLVAMGVPDQCVRVVRIGLPHLDAIAEAASQARALRNDPPVFAFHGGAAPHKGLHVFLEAVTQVHPDLRARFMVRGPVPESIRRAAPRVEFLPAYKPEELPGFIDAYDVGVSPHLWFENSPLTVLEHLAARKPVVASRLGGVPELVLNRESGLLVQPGSAEELADAIAEVAAGRSIAAVKSGGGHCSFAGFLAALER